MTLHDFTGAPCIGLPHIFESTLQAHHERAEALCNLCEHRTACDLQHRDTYHRAGAVGLPIGTWAGALYRADGSKDTGELTWRRAQEAHAAYKAGERSEGTLRGERAYQRMRVERKKRAA